MAADGNDNNQDVQRAVQAGSDLKQGSGPAYDNLQREVEAARVKYGDGTPGFNQFGQKVADGLKQTGALEEMSEQWALHHLDQVANSDQKHIKQADLNPVFGHNALEQAYLGSLQTNYYDLQHRAGETAFGNPRDKFGAKELDHVIETRQHERDVAENARLAQDASAREQAKFARVTGDLFANDGNPQHSLFAVLDGIKTGDGHTDGKISRSDLRRYQQDYSARAGHVPPDFGFTPENLEAVRTLDREWNKPLGLALRGTSPPVGSPRMESEEQPQPNGNINIEAASQALHVPAEQLFAAYGPQGAAAPAYSTVDAAGQTTDGQAVAAAAPIPGGAQAYDAQGNPVGAAPAPTDATVAAAPAAAQQYDAQGNPIGAAPGAAPGDGTAPAPIPRAVGPDGRPVPLASDAQPPAPAAAPPGAPSAYDDYYGPAAPAPGAPGAAPAADGGTPTLHRRRQAAGDTSGNPPAAPAPGDAAAAAPAKAGAVPDIDTAPPLALPDIKAGDDPNKIVADFQKAAIAHFAADAVYTVKPGQGWDRIARDTMRKSGEDASNETAVENYSNQIAKMNGLSGRLDKSHVLQPNEQVRVRDDAWIKAQVDAATQILVKKITDAAQAAAPAAPAAAAPADLYDGKRNGEGDITPPPGAPAAVVPAPGAADATPTPAAPAKDAPPTPAPAADAVVPAPPIVPTNAGDGPVPIPQGAPPAQVVGATTDVRTADVPPPGATVDPDANAAQVQADAARKQAAATPAVASNDATVPSPYGNPFDTGNS